MKKRPPVGLVSGGKLADSPVARLRGLADELGPVKGPTYRVASRIVNSLRAGYPVERWDDLASCRLILISVPDDRVGAVVEELAASMIPWHNKAVALCSTWLDASALTQLSLSGASVGSIMPIPGFEERRYLVEGNARLAKEVQRLLRRSGIRMISLAPALKPFFLASVNCTGSVLYSLIAAATDCLRQAGLGSHGSAAIIQRQVEKTLRAYASAGRKAFPPPKGLQKQLDALALMQPVLGQYLEQTAKAAQNLMKDGHRASAAGSSTS